jgi:cytochrome P450
VLLDTGFSDAELRDELMGLVLAGHETTATALAWTVHLLAHHRRACAALRADLKAGSDAYLKATIKESTRLRAPVIDAIRTATRDTELGGHPVPKGAYVSAMFCATHHAPELWPDPGAFRPERHLDDKPVPYSLTPFGGGVRRCIGASLAQLELEIALPELLSHAVPEPAGELEPGRVLGVSIVPAKGGRVVFRQAERTVAPAAAETVSEPLGSFAPGA